MWKDVTHPVDMFIEYLQSCLPVAFVDVTYDLMFNLIPYGIFKSIDAKSTDIPCSYSSCSKVGAKVVEIVSYETISFNIYIL